MPQVWLTYEELGDMFNFDPHTARAESIAHGWARRRCSDGATRVKLHPAAAHDYMVGYAAKVSRDAALSAPPAVHHLQERAVALRAELLGRPHECEHGSQNAGVQEDVLNSGDAAARCSRNFVAA